MGNKAAAVPISGLSESVTGTLISLKPIANNHRQLILTDKIISPSDAPSKPGTGAGRDAMIAPVNNPYWRHYR